MTTKTILTKAIEVVVFLFAAFSGFLRNVAPPEEANTVFAVGISSFLALIALLFVTAVSKNLPIRKSKRIWLIVSLTSFIVAIVSGILYKSNLDRLTFPYPPESTKAEYIGGTEMTAEAKAYKDRTEKSDASVVAAFGGLVNREQVWPPPANRSAKLKLTINYLVLVLSLATTVFSLTEGILRR